MRQDYARFRSRDAEILAIAADALGNAREYFQKHALPFPGLVDDAHAVYDLYDVQSKLTSLGQRPGLFLIDKNGVVRYAYLGTQQWEIPGNDEVLAQIDALTMRVDAESTESESMS